MHRNYNDLVSRIEVHADRDQAAQSFVNVAWEALHATGISWLGFYLHESEDELVLGPCRNKPACSPLGMHGACGRALADRRAVIVQDVSELGESYIACDPRDRSELVIPLFDRAGRCWGVFDADSHEIGAFSESDTEGFTTLLRKAGLTHP